MSAHLRRRAAHRDAVRRLRAERARAGRGRCGELFLCICRFRLVRGDVREVRSGVRDLAASGAPKAVYVVNRFDVEVPGTVVDHGDYTSVQNLTNETELARIGTPPRSRPKRARCTTRRRRKRRIAGMCRCPRTGR
ncbi:MAG: hypothetical protein ACLSVD_09030 [Eggerthellaceae bacterium]